jgi:hypothetical protein
VSEVALAHMRAAPRPVSRADLARHLASVRVPQRSAAVLARAGCRLQATGYRQDTPAEAAVAAAGAGLARLVEMLGDGATDAEAYRHAVAQLVGLGPGLTPTGDDVLVALLATARRLAAGDMLASAAADRLAEAVAEIPAGLTTPVAHRLLTEAAAGRFPAPLARLVEALGDAGVGHDALAELIVRLVATGAHSGADWLAGILALTGACLERGGGPWPSS